MYLVIIHFYLKNLPILFRFRQVLKYRTERKYRLWFQLAPCKLQMPACNSMQPSNAPFCLIHIKSKGALSIDLPRDQILIPSVLEGIIGGKIDSLPLVCCWQVCFYTFSSMVVICESHKQAGSSGPVTGYCPFLFASIFGPVTV